MRLFGFDVHAGALPPSSEQLAQAWRPYIETCIAAFGPERAMFESNFPVDKGSGSYPVFWNAFKRIAAGLLGRREEGAVFRHGRSVSTGSTDAAANGGLRSARRWPEDRPEVIGRRRGGCMAANSAVAAGAFMRPVGIHTAWWRYPGAYPDANFNLKT